jgi:predicted alpha/beta hydrolase family esterase
MPNKQSADYVAWKIWFERHFDFLSDQPIVLIGHSLGATFLLKYLSENHFTKKILQIHLVAPYVTDEESERLLKIATFKFDIEKISLINKICDDINLWHSVEDPAVPFSHSEIVLQYLPTAKLHKFTDRGHFNRPAFIEILQSDPKII